MSDPRRWAVVRRPQPNAPLRLFCFPHAGGAASAFAGWADALPGVEVVAVQPPGREGRLAEPPFDRLEPLVEAAHAALTPLWDRPFAFFGHSTGALVAYELIRRLRRDGRPRPLHLVASGRWAPHLQDPEPPVHALPREELIAALRRYDGTPEEVLDHREIMDLLLPLLRADFAIGDTYVHRAEPPVEVPITAVAGEEDPRVTADSLAAWGEHTRAPFAAHRMPGGHFYLFAERARLLRLLTSVLDPRLLAL